MEYNIINIIKKYAIDMLKHMCEHTHTHVVCKIALCFPIELTDMLRCRSHIEPRYTEMIVMYAYMEHYISCTNGHVT